jgi:hypothetical protein
LWAEVEEVLVVAAGEEAVEVDRIHFLESNWSNKMTNHWHFTHIQGPILLTITWLWLILISVPLNTSDSHKLSKISEFHKIPSSLPFIHSLFHFTIFFSSVISE